MQASRALALSRVRRGPGPPGSALALGRVAPRARARVRVAVPVPVPVRAPHARYLATEGGGSKPRDSSSPREGDGSKDEGEEVRGQVKEKVEEDQTKREREKGRPDNPMRDMEPEEQEAIMKWAFTSQETTDALLEVLRGDESAVEGALERIEEHGLEAKEVARGAAHAYRMLAQLWCTKNVSFSEDYQHLVEPHLARQLDDQLDLRLGHGKEPFLEVSDVAVDVSDILRAGVYPGQFSGNSMWGAFLYSVRSYVPESVMQLLWNTWPTLQVERYDLCVTVAVRSKERTSRDGTFQDRTHVLVFAAPLEAAGEGTSDCVDCAGDMRLRGINEHPSTALVHMYEIMIRNEALEARERERL